MREGRLRQMVTETDEDTGRETENTQQCQAAAVADTDTGQCQRDEVRWKEIGGWGRGRSGSRETQNKHLPYGGREREGRRQRPDLCKEHREERQDGRSGTDLYSKHQPCLAQGLGNRG